MTRARLLVVGATLVATLASTGSPVSAATTSSNQLQNGRAEAKPGGTGQTVSVPAWTRLIGKSFTAVKYGAAGFPSPMTPGPKDRGKNFFAGGNDKSESIIVAVQDVDLKKWSSPIDNNKAFLTLAGWFGGKGAEGDQAWLEAHFVNARGDQVGDTTYAGPVSAAERANKTRLMYRATHVHIPIGTRYVHMGAVFQRFNGNYNDGYMDNAAVLVSTI